ncbi:MAG: STAS domain-containing protein [Phycisphaeraceae bacterium]
MPVQKWSDRIWVAQLVAGASFHDDMDYLQARLPARRRAPDIVLDLTAMEYIDSPGLAQLLVLRRLLIENDARLRLVGPVDRVWALLLTTGLDKVFEFATDTTTALTELQIET